MKQAFGVYEVIGRWIYAEELTKPSSLSPDPQHQPDSFCHKRKLTETLGHEPRQFSRMSDWVGSNN